MKTHAFIICGYGVPKDMKDDLHYQIYIRTAFNKIYTKLQSHPGDKGIIVVTGGPTDMRKPYKRTEAGEMAKLLKELLARPTQKEFRKHVRVVEENKSLSSMENILFSLRKLSITPASVTIFCEWTRRKKLGIFGKKIFKKNVSIDPIDFDQSANRFLDPEFINKKEALDIKISLKALNDPAVFRKLHKSLERKFAELRAAGPENHVKAVREWWEKEMKQFEKK